MANPGPINTAPPLTMSPLAWGLLVMLSIFWGGSFFFIGIAVSELPTFTIVILRVGLASLVLWVVLLVSRTELPKEAGFWGAIAVMSVFNSALPFLMITWGQSHIPSGLASIFIATTPLFAVFAAHFMTVDEKMTVPKIAGIAAGIVGVVVLIGPGLLGDLGTNVLAQLAILGAAFCYALSGIFGRRFSRQGVPPLTIATCQISGSTILLMPFALAIDRPWELAVPSVATMAAVLGLALVSTALAYLVFFRILAIAGATNLLLVNFLVPVSAIILGVLVLGETLQAEHVAGMAMIFVGLVLIDGKLLARLRRGP